MPAGPSARRTEKLSAPWPNMVLGDAHDGSGFELAQYRSISRQDEDRFGADLFERDRKSADDIAEAAGLGPG